MEKSPIATSIAQALQEHSCTSKQAMGVIRAGSPTPEEKNVFQQLARDVVNTPSPAEMRDRIVDFEETLNTMPGQFTPPVEQFFGEGVYIRQVFLPAGTIATGKIHKEPCWNILIQGELEVVTEDGYKIMVAPCIFRSKGGMKRAGRVISDTIWATVHAYDGEEQDSDAMADLLTVPSYAQLESHCRNKALK